MRIIIMIHNFLSQKTVIILAEATKYFFACKHNKTIYEFVYTF